MSPEILKSLKITLLIELAVWLVFGIIFTFFVDYYVVWFNWPDWDPTAERYIGVIFLSLAFVSFLAYREKDWDRIELFIILDFILCITGGIIQLIGVFIYDTGWAGWFNFALQMVFFVAILYFYILQQKQ